MITFLDTSALLNGRADDAKLYEKFYLSPLTLVELENIKTSSSKDDSIKFLARKAVRDILFNEKYEVCRYINDKKIDKFIKKHPELKDINDHRIIATAAILEKDRNEEVNFITSDGAQYLAAWNVNIHATFFEKKEEREEYYGWKKVEPTEEELVELYSNPTNNILKANINEYCEIYENELSLKEFC